MALALYKENNAGSLIDLTNYLHSAHDALNGSWNTIQIWLRNDNGLVYYENVQVSMDIPGVIDAPNVSPNGIVYQLYPGDVKPTLIEWKHIPYHNTISLPDIGASGASDTVTYSPFWLRIYQPGNSSVGQIQDASVKVTAIERVA